MPVVEHLSLLQADGEAKVLGCIVLARRGSHQQTAAL